LRVANSYGSATIVLTRYTQTWSGEIARDVDRTFPTIPFFSGDSDGKRQLGNVLKAVALHATDIGYCQVRLKQSELRAFDKTFSV
jgi:hypothetical protein